MKNNKGLSPIIATVLLISIVIVIATTIFLWVRGLAQESVTKFGENVELVCGDVQIDASYDGNNLYINNEGNVPVKDLSLRLKDADGSYESTIASDAYGFEGLLAGDSWSEFISSTASDIVIIPVILGTDENGNEKEFVCGENYGIEVGA